MSTLSRTASVAAALWLVGCSCEDAPKEPTAPPKSRSQGVAAPEPTVSAAPKPSAQAEPKKPAAPRELCGDQVDEPGKPFPVDASVSKVAKAGAKPLPDAIELGEEWTWLNFWAAWCVPCKAEMPLLLKWERELRKGGAPFRLTFVSIDDDSRQLDGFLEKEAPKRFTASYWLKEGDERKKFLEALGFEEEPELPFHVLIDKEKKIRCIIEGAVEETDFGQAAEIVADI